MLKNNFLKFGAYVGSLPVLILPLSVSAAANPLDTAIGSPTGGLGKIGAETGLGQNANDLPTLIGRIIAMIIGVVGIVLVVYVIQAGIMYMTASGDPDKTKKAKAMIQTAMIGIILIIAAYSISSFVLTTLKAGIA